MNDSFESVPPNNKDSLLQLLITRNRSSSSFLEFPEDFGVAVPTAGAEDVLEDEEGSLRHALPWTLMLILGYAFIFVVGMIGNVCVVFVILRTRSMRTVTNLFILNLAAADLLVIFFCIPATLFSNIFIPWVLGWWMCKGMNYIQGVSVCASVYSLVAISVDKLFGVWFPMKSRLRKPRAYMAIGLIWTLSSLIILPWAIVFDLVEGEDGVVYCVENWTSAVDGKLYFLVGNMLLCYLLPLSIVIVCYALIWAKVIRRKVPMMDSALGAGNMKRVHRKTKYGVTRMLVVVILVFALSWLPLYIMFARWNFGNLTEWEQNVYEMARPIAQWLGSSNSCINPVLYTFLNKRFRTAFLALSPCGRRRAASPSTVIVNRSLGTPTTMQRKFAVGRQDHRRACKGIIRIGAGGCGRFQQDSSVVDV